MTENSVRHLWEIDHPYYGVDGYENDVDSFATLRQTVDASDEDMNFVYRWDWKDNAQPQFDGLFLDGEDRSNEVFTVYLLMPRKPGFWSVTCPIRKDQEFEVLDWLSGPRCAGYLRTMWAPVLDSLPLTNPTARETAVWGHHVSALEVLHASVTEQLDAARRRAGDVKA